ncbi:MAG TPA: Rv2175c family DNA-binding protein [Nocardia sp.]|uniref:Rv2175c family DNA-binding protein n=1 Tax=Nocardia TaxID=1817 RepID=UPI002453C7BA|nr:MULTISPECIES: Rv2175c family DNA-binding protein [Nocardia]HLS77646.1 Rv2175c family DNA-binding protein [Nocardia sp.]
MSSFPCSKDVLADSVPLLSVPEVADRLGVVVTRVHQMLREHQILAVRRDGVPGIPEIFFDRDTGQVVKMLPGLITVMRDSKYTDEEILEWIFTDDPSLPGKPVEALHGPLAREVVRRAAAEPF